MYDSKLMQQKIGTVDVTFTPETQAFIQAKLAEGETVDSVVNRAIAFLEKAEAQRIARLREEIRKGEESGSSRSYDWDNPDDREAFWAEVEALGEAKHQSGTLNYNSAALPAL